MTKAGQGSHMISVNTVKMSGMKFFFYLSFTAFICCKIYAHTQNDDLKHPIVLVPGDGGSQYEARLNKPKVIHFWCKQTSDWFEFWLNMELLVPYVIDCFADNMRLVYNPETHTTSNSPGVETRNPGFGNSTTVEWLDESHFAHTEYFYDIAENLVKKAGYVRNVQIRGAPYDFRKAPNEMGEYIDKLRKLVENTYELNNNTKVVLLGHSMGSPYALYMLNQQSQGWKNKYIKSLISLAGPWGGAVKVLRLYASGDNLGVFVVNPLSARVEQRSMPTSAWLLPYDTFWNSSEVLVYAPTYNYTVNDYERFFKDINYTNGYLMRQDTEPLIKQLTPPGVEVHCLHGDGVDTPAHLVYTKKDWFDSQPDVIFGDGDGTVNMRSLLGCLPWNNTQKQAVKHQVYSGAEHMGILRDERVKQYILNVVTGKDVPPV